MSNPRPASLSVRDQGTKGPAPELSRHQSPRSVYNPPSLRILVPRGTNDPYEISQTEQNCGRGGSQNRVWRKSCSAPPWSHLCTTGKYCPKFKIKGSGLSRKQGRASRAGPSVARVARATPAPGAASLIQTLVGHCTPWRGGASPGGGSGRRLGRACQSLSRVPQGTPGHLQRSRTPALPACAMLRGSPHPTRCQP